MTLDRKSILDFEDTDIGRVNVAKFGGEVCVASLSAEEVSSASKLTEQGVPTNVIWTILGACDETGKRLFTVEDAPALGKKPAKALTAIAKAVLEHNGQTEEADNTVKNASSETDEDSSSSGSPVTSDEPSQS